VEPYSREDDKRDEVGGRILLGDYKRDEVGGRILLGDYKRDEIGGRILLGDYKGGVPVVLRPIRIQRAGLWVSTGLLLLHTRVYSRQRKLHPTSSNIPLAPYLPDF
jgi:hypothetical protein